MTMPEINTVIFDLGGVLVGLERQRMSTQMAQLAGISVDEVIERLRGGYEIFAAYERGMLNAVEVYRWAAGALGLSPEQYPFERFREHWCAVLVRSPEMESLFAQVNAVCRTCILSNSNDLHWSWVAEKMGVLHRAEATLTSFQTGLYKPELEIFHVALDRFGVEDPASAVVIDDYLDNVDAARAVGMPDSFPHESPRTTRERLVELGVLTVR